MGLKDDTLESRLELFCLLFSRRFHKILQDGGKSKFGQTAFERKGIVILRKLVVPVAGAASEYALGGRGGNQLGAQFVKWCSSKIEKAKSKRVSKKNGNVSEFSKDFVVLLMEVLSSASVEVFACYEHQLVRINSSIGGWQTAFIEVANDAVARIMNYANKPEIELTDDLDEISMFLMKGILSGKSKEKISPTVLKYLISGIEWHLPELWVKPGVTIGDQYLTPINTNPRKHGYRRLLPFENKNPDDLKAAETYTSDAFYSYDIIKDLESYKKRIYDYILPQEIKLECVMDEHRAFMGEPEVYKKEIDRFIESMGWDARYRERELEQIQQPPPSPGFFGNFFGNIFGRQSFSSDLVGPRTPSRMHREPRTNALALKRFLALWELEKMEFVLMKAAIDNWETYVENAIPSEKVDWFEGMDTIEEMERIEGMDAIEEMERIEGMNAIEEMERFEGMNAIEEMENWEIFKTNVSSFVKVLKMYIEEGLTLMKKWGTFNNNIFKCDTDDEVVKVESTYNEAKKTYLKAKETYLIVKSTNFCSC